MIVREENFPRKESPEWAPQVERWYQLDGPAFALANTYHHELRDETLPDLVVLADDQASNETDFHFVESGADSPTKFVHTLPNVRGSSLLQVMKTALPLITVQAGADSFRKAQDLARRFAQCRGGRAWVFHVGHMKPAAPHRSRYKVRVWLGDGRMGDSA